MLGRRGRSVRTGAAAPPRRRRRRRPTTTRLRSPSLSRAGDRAGRARPRVADRVLDQVLDDDLEHPRAQRQLERRGAVDPELIPARSARSRVSATTWSITGSARIEPSATTARPLSSSLRKSTSSISSPIRKTSLRDCSIRSVWSAPGRGALQQREQAGEGRAELVRDGRREPGA